MLQIHSITTKQRLFTLSKYYRQSYLIPLENFKKSYPASENIALPLVIDSEFKTPHLEDYHTDNFTQTLPVTVQIKHTHLNDAQIFVHPIFSSDTDKQLRHPVIKHPLIMGDYLENKGCTVDFERVDYETLKGLNYPTLLIVLYAHFALADLRFFGNDDFQDDMARRFAGKTITMKRRLLCGGFAGTVRLNWIITLNGINYKLALKVIDSIAIHGQASYKELCNNAGIELESKDVMGNDIKFMDKAYFDNPDYDAYSLGDLKVYDALQSNAENMRLIYDDLGIGDYYQQPKLSIGSTVSALFESKIYNYWDISASNIPKNTAGKQDLFDTLTYKATTAFLSNELSSNAYTLAKCDGGRCKSNNPLLTNLQGDLFDTDIAGAYGSAMSTLVYPFGTPVIYATAFHRNNPIGIPLKNVLKAFKGVLKAGLWVMRINVAKLTHEQDLISSWFDYAIHRITRSDTGALLGGVDVMTGTTKLFTEQIKNGVLTSDLLEVIEQWTPRHKKDFYDKCEVIALAFYPAKLEVSKEDFLIDSKHKTYTNNSKLLKGFNLITQDNHTWHGVDLGEFFTDVLQANRSKHAKGTPLNTLCKLLVNTTYGCQVTRFFMSANIILGNNITARVRSVMYMKEKALNLVGSITDGQVGDLNNVLHRKETKRGVFFDTTKLARLYRETKHTLNKNNIGLLKPLDGITDKSETNINQAALAHVAKVWNLSALLNAPCKRLKPINGKVSYIESTGVFQFEMKHFVDNVTVHGSSNYSFNPLDSKQTKFRSYESKKEHYGYLLNDDNELIKTSDYDTVNPAQCLLNEIKNNPHSVKRLPPFVKMAILKPSMYADNYKNYWQDSPLQPADNYIKNGAISYFSLSAFLFKNESQFTEWKKSHEKLKRKYNESFELFFTNHDGTIDYQNMLITINNLICDGVIYPLDYFDKHDNFHRVVLHPVIQNRINSIKALKDKNKALQLYDDDADDVREDNNSSDKDDVYDLFHGGDYE